MFAQQLHTDRQPTHAAAQSLRCAESAQARQASDNLEHYTEEHRASLRAAQSRACGAATGKISPRIAQPANGHLFGYAKSSHTFFSLENKFLLTQHNQQFYHTHLHAGVLEPNGIRRALK